MTETILAAVGTILGTALLVFAQQGLAMLREHLDRQTIIGAATRAAGQVVAQVQANPVGSVALGALTSAATDYVLAAAPSALNRLGVNSATVSGMVQGELGKLLAPAAAPEAAQPITSSTLGNG